jgi:hypothetical protein
VQLFRLNHVQCHDHLWTVQCFSVLQRLVTALIVWLVCLV